MPKSDNIVPNATWVRNEFNVYFFYDYPRINCTKTIEMLFHFFPMKITKRGERNNIRFLNLCFKIMISLIIACTLDFCIFCTKLSQLCVSFLFKNYACCHKTTFWLVLQTIIRRNDVTSWTSVNINLMVTRVANYSFILDSWKKTILCFRTKKFMS